MQQHSEKDQRIHTVLSKSTAEIVPHVYSRASRGNQLLTTFAATKIHASHSKPL